MTYKCELSERPAQPTLSVRMVTSVQKLPQEMGRVYSAIAGYLARLGEYPAGAPFAAYYNMDMDNLDVEIGFPVAHPIPATGEILAGQIAAGKVATVVFVGPYSEIEPAYTALSQWMAEEGLQPAGVAYEMYLNDPTVTPPGELQTQILLPLK